MSTKQLIAVVCCQKQVGGYDVQSVNEFYLNAIRDFGGLPVLIPAGSDEADLDQILATVDGVLLPGSHSNVAPQHYGADHDEPKQDPGRDQLALSIIRQCAALAIPVLGICRGFQEMNVALGGTLHPQVHCKSNALDHREPNDPDFSVKYAVSHSLEICPGGHFASWLGETRSVSVNSLHGQGVETLAPALKIEAVAPDGLIEAFSLPNHPYFIGVQWHPEWFATELFMSELLFSHFIQAAQALKEKRNGKTANRRQGCEASQVT
ncbi:gamma-glutamyl-gamma-aminobutyrate hydrolase family protein [Photobacterium sp. MCCC 1A19761]|uniref:gamma-glutamyl-gamma-aminobutyrate hydrolase family protein n=1 Tax=Photobacterium sp. MCCC 1A19761 TaxID=3115000 RepID=UPI00307DC10F